MKKIVALLLVVAATMSSCMKQDLDEIRSRLSNLEAWQQSVNGDIATLRALVSALEAQDFVTSVTPLTDGTGYVINFVKSGAVTIKHGNSGQIIVVGAKLDTDGKYYWTVGGEWLMSGGTKMALTDKVPQVRANDNTKKWDVSVDGGTTWIATNIAVAAGSIFAPDGIDNTHADYVIFTLADGTTKITLPKANMVTVGFDSYELFMGSTTNNQITLILPSTLKESDYTAIVATVTNENGTGMDIQTRAAATESTWGVKITKPTFDGDGKLVVGSAKVTLTAPNTIDLAQTAMLKATITDKNGKEFSATRPLKYFDGQVVTCEAGGLSAVVTDTQVAKLAVKGAIGADDFAFIQTLTALEVLDLSMTNLTTIEDEALWFTNSNTTLKRIIIPASVTTIGEMAFRNCGALETFDLVNTESLGLRAFQNCIKMRSVKLGDKLTAIDQLAFFNCQSLESIHIPGSVTSFGRRVFEACHNLERVTLEEGVRNLGEGVFYGCGVVSIRIPSTITELPRQTFRGCKNLERITLHNGITLMGEQVFAECISLRAVKIPTGVTVIPFMAFAGCKSLNFVTFHNAITEIGESAFDFCSNLTDEYAGQLVLPTSLKTLGTGAFADCTSLFAVDMKETAVTAIPGYLFAGCTKMNGVTLPKGLQSIGLRAFRSLKIIDITLPATITSIGDYAFTSCANLMSVRCNAPTAPTIGAKTFDPLYKTGRSYTVPSHTSYDAWMTHFSTRYGL